MNEELREILGESWEVCPPEDAARADEQINVIDSDGLKVANVFEWPEFPVKLLARGHLISAAPDLYAVLRAIVDYYEGAGIGPCPEGQDDADEPDGFDASERCNVRRARAVLAKARGEAPS